MAIYGGGAGNSTLNNCTIIGNSAGGFGGGASGGTLNNCTLSNNSASNGGGGVAGGTLCNCMLTCNSADCGGGVVGSKLNNCTLTGNSAYRCDGGAGGEPCILNNCIVYFNTAPVGANYNSFSTLNYCCTTPLPNGGTGNISVDPQLASASHLSVFSPCRGAGSAAYTSGVDIDGEAWGTAPSIGCDEYHAGAVTGPLSVDIIAAYTNVGVGYSVSLTGLIEGRTSMSIWDFGDGGLALDRPYETHAWTAPGDYRVSLWAFNDSQPEGVSATVTVHVEQGLHYVAADSANPVPPYTSWTTAATNIQAAIDAAVPGTVVVVTNGVYGTGGRAVLGTMTNRVVVDRPVVVKSVHGPGVTVIRAYQVPETIDGDGAIRCVYLSSGAVLSGFTLTNGATRTDGSYTFEQSGGGVWCQSSAALVTNCTLRGNSAESGGGAYGGTLNNCTLSSNLASGWGGSGGGAYGCTLNNCTLTGNSAESGGGVNYSTLNNCSLTGNSAYHEGGGAGNSTLNNCTLTGNSAYYGGGASGLASGSALNNCILYYNTAPDAANFDSYSTTTLNYCCTPPLPTTGVGNITNTPLFVDYLSGTLRLQSNCPCINAANNAYVTNSTDLDGLPRIVSGTVDIGAYEFQGLSSVISYAWLQQYGLPTDGSADATDADGDGMNNWQEWRCGTCPTNASSALRLLSPQRRGTNVTMRWQSVLGVSYFLERSTNLAASPPFSLLAPNLPGQTGTTTYTDTNVAGASPLFYRVGVGQ